MKNKTFHGPQKFLRCFFLSVMPIVFLAACGGSGGGGGDAGSSTGVRSGNGAATLSWTPPTTNADGTGLSDLAGYRIYYGLQEDNYTELADNVPAGVTTYMIENLAPDTYYFVMTAVDTSGNESPRSNMASKTVM